jgi:hypothetical protein
VRPGGMAVFMVAAVAGRGSWRRLSSSAPNRQGRVLRRTLKRRGREKEPRAGFGQWQMTLLDTSTRHRHRHAAVDCDAARTPRIPLGFADGLPENPEAKAGGVFRASLFPLLRPLRKSAGWLDRPSSPLAGERLREGSGILDLASSVLPPPQPSPAKGGGRAAASRQCVWRRNPRGEGTARSRQRPPRPPRPVSPPSAPRARSSIAAARAAAR